MKKIKSKIQLRAEKKRIRNRQAELEKKIRYKWDELKLSLKPVNIAKETFQQVLKEKTEKNMEEESIFKSTLRYGFSLLAKKFTDKTAEKFDWLFTKNGKKHK